MKGKTASEKAQEFRYGQMDLGTPELGKMIKVVARGFLNMLTGMSMRGNGRKIKVEISEYF